jgi:hypothetical protein
LPSEEVLRNRESVEAEVELGGLRLLWEAFEKRTGEEVERVRLTAAMGWAATVVVIVGSGVSGAEGNETARKRGEWGGTKLSMRAAEEDQRRSRSQAIMYDES